ncbi:amidohydrolase family protein [Leisingera aquimarina]|uniref:amidohydrolase family protein n=1 Tax=Leisingera aquimarina TaxID=476529 RepID=UPI000402BF2E|nr:amidohydrolase family protein [Leisingera aquimarina]
MGDTGDIFSACWVIVDTFDSRKDCAIYVRDGRVRGIAPLQDLTSRFPEARVHVGENVAILPGFVNAHHHCFGVNLVNQGISDDLLEPWILATAGAAAISSKTSTEYAALRLLKNGVTAVVDACTPGATAALAEVKIREKIDVYNRLGMSCAIAPGERWQNRLVHPAGQDTDFLASLPQDLREKLEHQHLSRVRMDPATYLGLVVRLAEENATTENADVWFGPVAPHWTGHELLRDIGFAVQHKGLRMQTHAAESLLQHLSAGRPEFQSPVAELAQAGLLNKKLSLAHMVWADDNDLQQVAEMGAHIVCNPSSNLRLRSGIARAPQMMRLGINLALGMDGTSLAGDEDMFAEMRLARNLYWSADPAERDLCAQDVFDMATMGGARQMGMDHNIGSLTEGKRADFMIVSLENLQGPWLSDRADPIELLVSSAKSSDILSVYTSGSLAVYHGKICNRDEQSVFRDIADNMQHAADQRLRAEDYAIVRSALLRWYDDWLTEHA